jgi:hypothetical protein
MNFIARLWRRPLSAAFLKGDKKRGGDSGDDPWKDVPTPKVWLAD